MPTALAMSSIWASRTPRSSKSRRVAEMISASRSRRRAAAVPPLAPVAAAVVDSVLMAVSLGRTRARGRARCGSMPAWPPSDSVACSLSLPCRAAWARCSRRSPHCRRRRPGQPLHRHGRAARLLRCRRPLVVGARHRPGRGDHQRSLRALPFLGAREVARRRQAFKTDRAARRLRARSRRPSAACGCAYASMYRTDLAVYELPRDVRRPRGGAASPRSPSPTRGRRGATGSGSRPATGSSSVPARPPGRRTALHERDVGLVALDPAARPGRLRASAAATPARRSCPATPARSSGSRTPATSAAVAASTRPARRTARGRVVMRRT